jgi:hypothetical protein
VDIQEAAVKPAGTMFKSVALTMSLEAEVHALAARAKAEGKTFTWKAEEAGLAVSADEDLLRRAFRLAGDRMLDDSPAGSIVHATAAAGGGVVRIRIMAPPPSPDAPHGTTAESVELAFIHLAIEFMGGQCAAASMPDLGTSLEIDLPVPSPATSVGSPTKAGASGDPVTTAQAGSGGDPVTAAKAGGSGDPVTTAVAGSGGDPVTFPAEPVAEPVEAAPPPALESIPAITPLDDAVAMASMEADAWAPAAPPPETKPKLVHTPPPPPQEQPQAPAAKDAPGAETPAGDAAAGNIKIIGRRTHELGE